jgi:NAD(P)-dependent dehydrogenase (short-subunit alcohol dehydrogenase family)
MEEMENHSGRLLFTQELAQLREEFPSVTRLLRPSRVEALGCSTYLIGMVVPGLHSIYGALDLQLTTDASIGNEIQFAVTTVDPRLRRVQLKIRGPGMSGSLEAFTRVPPVRQPAIAEIAEHVANGEFAASTALVIGGSRGLGELTAKIIAAGGGRAIVSYAQGKRDAETLASEITDWGGKCEILSYDIREQADRQLEALKHSPTHLYYFATPTISKGNMRGFSPGRFAEFNEFYIHGFARLIDAAARRTPEGISVFYPSSAFVRDRPQHMTEYAMSKAAGEILCADIARTVKGVRVHTERLPRLRTDQTSTLSQINVSSSVSVMLPIIRKLHERTAPEG